MTAKDLVKYVGREGKFKINGFAFDVEILDAKEEARCLSLLIKPSSGEGQHWCSASWIIFEEGK